MKRNLVTGAVTIAVLALAPPAVAAPSEKAGPFLPGGFSGVLDPGPFFCDFPVEVEVVGRTRTLTHSGGRTTDINPGMRATLTNPATGESVSYSISGTVHRSPLPDGTVEVVQVGRNLVGDPVLGLSILSGRFVFTSTPDGVPLTPAEGTGRVISICEVLS